MNERSFHIRTAAAHDPRDTRRPMQRTAVDRQLATRNFSKAGDKMTFSAVFVLATAVHAWNG